MRRVGVSVSAIALACIYLAYATGNCLWLIPGLGLLMFIP